MRTSGTLWQSPPSTNHWRLLRLLSLGEELGSRSSRDRNVCRAGWRNSYFQPFQLPEACCFAHHTLYTFPSESWRKISVSIHETSQIRLYRLHAGMHVHQCMHICKYKNISEYMWESTGLGMEHKEVLGKPGSSLDNRLWTISGGSWPWKLSTYARKKRFFFFFKSTWI